MKIKLLATDKTATRTTHGQKEAAMEPANLHLKQIPIGVWAAITGYISI
jgi:hypothetical protein